MAERTIEELSEIEECIVEGCRRAKRLGMNIFPKSLYSCALSVQFPEVDGKGTYYCRAAESMGLSEKERGAFVLGFDGRSEIAPVDFHLMGRRVRSLCQEELGFD